MPEYKLIYFDARGAAEPIRQILSYAGQKFEDVRLPPGKLSDEQKEKLKLTWGQVPVLVVDGEVKAQCNAIVRYLAKKYKLDGKNEKEEFRCDELSEAIRDVLLKMQPIGAALFTKDAAKLAEVKKTFLETDGAVAFKRFNDILEKNGKTYLVGTALTYVDIQFASLIFQINSMLSVTVEKDFPAIEKLCTAVQKEPKLRTWFATRPKTIF